MIQFYAKKKTEQKKQNSKPLYIVSTLHTTLHGHINTVALCTLIEISPNYTLNKNKSIYDIFIAQMIKYTKRNREKRTL